MLKKIKSSYFVRIFFSYIEEKKKSKIVKCNKNLQKNINISIINYKHFSGKYLIYESDGNVKKYNGYDDTLLFEGRLNGIGKEYDEYNILIYEGEYLNGQRNGKGKEYYDNGKLKFEGEYLNGQRNGKGKKFYDNGNLKFEGEFKYGKKWKGTLYDYNGKIIYKLNNIINGKGKEYYMNGELKFEGEYLNGKRHGKGKEYLNGILIYEDEYLNGQRNGKGKEFYDNGKLKFEGEYKLVKNGTVKDMIH